MLEKNYLEKKYLSAGIPREYLKYHLVPNDNKKGYSIFDLNGDLNKTKLEALKFTMTICKLISQKNIDFKNIFFHGYPNKKLGITLLGTFILRVAIAYNYSAKFISFPSLCQNLSYDNNLDSDEKSEYYTADFLLIDAITARSQTVPRISDALCDILLTRNHDGKKTIFCSYISAEEFALRYSESLLSYFEESVTKISLIHNDKYSGIYAIDKLIKFLKETSKEKKAYTYEELIETINIFVKKHNTDNR